MIHYSTMNSITIGIRIVAILYVVLYNCYNFILGVGMEWCVSDNVGVVEEEFGTRYTSFQFNVVFNLYAMKT